MENKPRSFKASQQSANLLLSVKPEVLKITKQLQEDAEVKISAGTMLFFGFLLFVGIFVISILLFNGRSLKLTEEVAEGDGRGINLPTVVPPSDSPEGQEYTRKQEEMAKMASDDHPLAGKESTGSEQAKPPSHSPPPKSVGNNSSEFKPKVEFFDQHGRPVDISPADYGKYKVMDVI